VDFQLSATTKCRGYLSTERFGITILYSVKGVDLTEVPDSHNRWMLSINDG